MFSLNMALRTTSCSSSRCPPGLGHLSDTQGYLGLLYDPLKVIEWVGWVGWVAHKILETAQSPNSSIPFWGWNFWLGLGLGLVNYFYKTLQCQTRHIFDLFASHQIFSHISFMSTPLWKFNSSAESFTTMFFCVNLYLSVKAYSTSHFVYFYYLSLRHLLIALFCLLVIVSGASKLQTLKF